MSDAAPLTTKEKVRKILILLGVFFGFAILAVLTLRQPVELAPVAARAEALPKAGASPDAFAKGAVANPYSPEYRDAAPPIRTRDSEQFGASDQALDTDAILEQLRDAAEADQERAMHANAAPDSSYVAQAPATAPAISNVQQIGTIELRSTASTAGVAPTETSDRQAAPGTLIRATLAHAVSSDFPGSPWMALVTADAVRPDGSIAVQMGETIMGTIAVHDGPNAVLQSRVTLTAMQIIGQDGTPRPIKAAVLDATGIAGIPGDTSHHVIAQGAGVTAAALLGASAAASTSGDPYSTQAGFQAQAAQGAAQQVQPAISKYLNVMPTTTVPAGTPLTLMLTEAA